MKAIEAKSLTKSITVDDVYKRIKEQAIPNHENKVYYHPSIFFDENVKEQLLKNGYKLSYFTDQMLGEQGLKIEW